MWKLLFSDYDTDKISLVNGKRLSLTQCIQDYAIPDKMKFTVVGLYADKKKYTVVYNNNPFIFAYKNFSTHKDNNKYWLVLLDLRQNKFSEFVVKSDNLLKDIKTFSDFMTVPAFTKQTLDDLNPLFIDPINLQYNNGEPYMADLSEIDRVWVEQLRGKKLGE